MPRYIDADMLREKMYHEAFEKDSEDQRWNSGCWIRYRMFENAVDSIPTADVVERKKAKWIEDGYYKLPAVCSRCGSPGVIDFKYCPYCGARMSEEETTDAEIH